jgi:hypothetical protein
LRRAHSLPIAFLAAAMLAGAAVAQTPQPAVRQDLRQLSWPGRNTAAAPANAPAGARQDLRRSNLVIPHGGFGASGSAPAGPAPTTPRRTLTPANAWLQPASPNPAPAPTPAMPVPVRTEAPPPPAPPASRPAATPEYLPDQGGRGQRAPADIVYAAPPEPAPPGAAPDQPADPMAPRRDAPIFRLQRTAPPPESVAEAPAAAQQGQPAAPRLRPVAEVTNTGERPPQQGARYYSVHRQNGRQPDTLTMPEPTYVDALAITMTQTPASQDLAEPEQGPTLIRDSQGRNRPVPAASDGDHQ